MTISTAPAPLAAKAPATAKTPHRKNRFWSWVIFIVVALYFLVPLAATFYWSLRAKKDVLGLEAYRRLFADASFLPSFSESIVNAIAAIFISLLIIVPTAYWVTLRLPRLRSVVEFITLLPFVIPAVVLVFGLIRLYSRPPLLWTATYDSSRVLLICVYAALSFPYMFRAVDNGLRAMDVRSLTEAAQSLGAGWPTILLQVIFPNLRVALLSGALLTFAIVIGELTIALFMAQHTLGPYMAELTRSKVYEPSAMAIVAFALTWAALGLIQLIGRGQQGQIAGGR
ncbi:MAG TPA: ABC transporter permease subunit [Anaerolineales bacterium]|nr:ABC transporter permease subunit [Anaerolineales bacterium]